MKKLMMLAVAVAAAMPLMAETEYANGYTWTYCINTYDDTAEIQAGISPSPIGNVAIPATLGGKTVTSIGLYAFYDCTGLTSVTISGSVTSIGMCAFEGCSGLTSVTIPGSVTSIGMCAFDSCSGLTSVTIPNSVTVIGSFAFFGCSGLTSVTIPNSVTIISDRAFSGCSGLTSVTIPNSVTVISDRAFSGCSGLTSVTIPNSVTSIGWEAFDGCRGLTSVTIPNSVTSIGGSAFSGCSGLTSVTIPGSVTSIGGSAFSGCSGLTSVTIGNGVTGIGGSAFSGCSGLTSVSIPNSVTVISDRVFSGCSGLTSVTIPNSVTSIGWEAFSGCSGLTSVTIPNSVTIIESSAFSGCIGLTSVTIPDSVTSIESSVFSGCSGLTSVTIPDSVTSIGERAFDLTPFFDNQPDGLVVFGKVAYTMKGTCPAAVTIPDGVTGIGYSAFGGCSGLKSVTIPDSVTIIGGSAFSGCSGLTSVTIPNSVTIIESSAFSGCSGLTSVTIPDSVTSIGSSAFSGCSGLASVTIPQCGVGSFRSAFSGYNNLAITLSDRVTSIEGYAFSGCNGLTSVTIPNSVTSIGSWAFFSCSGLTAVHITDLDAWCRISFGTLGNPLYFAHNLYLNGSLVTDLVIPNGVTSIGDYAFSGCSGLTSVTIPASVTSIGYGAFEGCSGLVNVTVNQCVCNSGMASVFPSFSGRVLISDGVTNIGDYAFSGCGDMKSVLIPDSVMHIGKGAFRDCSSLMSVTIPNSIMDIGLDAFAGCTCKIHIAAVSKRDVQFDLTSFGSCPILWSIPSGTESVPVSAFAGCSSLRVLDVPASVRRIGVGAFADGVKTVVFHGAPPEVVDENGNVIDPDTYASGGVFGPYGSIPSDVHVVYPPEFADEWGGEQRMWCGAHAGCGPDVTITPGDKTVFSDSVSVSITSSWTNAVIYYMADGVEPTEASPVYRKPITVNRPCTIKATAISPDCEWSHVVTAQFGYGRTANPRIWSDQGTTFYHRDNMVSFYSDTAGAEYVYTLDGSDPTKGGIEYTGSFSISTSTVVKVVAKSTDNVDSDVVEQSFTRLWETVETPEIRTGDMESANVVTITCWPSDAKIYYTTDGSDPTNGGTEYTGPFVILGETQVRAYAAKEDWLPSAVVSKDIPKSWNSGDAVEQSGRIFVSTTLAAWSEDKSVSYSGGSSLRSGKIGDGEKSDLNFWVAGKGTVSFHWRTSCEDDPFMDNTDYVRFLVDGVEKGRLDGISGWEAFSTYISVDGPHVLTWEYVKDGQDSEGEDCAWLDDVGFRPDVMAWIRFNGNDNTSGTLPEAISHYLGEKVTLPGQGDLMREKYDFIGWSDGTKVYGPMSVYEAPDKDITLLAAWAPKLTPPPTIYAPEQYAGISTNVSISASGGAVIYYTTDGSEPTEASTRYWGSFEVTGTTVIKAIAVAEDRFPSEIVTKTAECLWKSVVVSGVTWYYTADGTLKKGVGLSGKAVLPDRLNGTAITKIGRSLFWIKGIGDVSDPVAIVVPEGIVEMEYDALWGCDNLEAIVLPSTLKKIGDGCFSYCNCLGRVYWCMSVPPAIDQGSDGWGGIYDGSNASLISYLPKGWGNLSTHRWNERAFVEWTPPSNGATGMIDEIVGAIVPRVTVTFNANGGYADETERKVDSGSAIGTLPVPTRMGYDFGGWFTAKSGGAKYQESTKVNADVTLYAHWTPISYAIRYELEGGVNAAGNPNSYTIEQRIVLAAPTKAGYTFKGWTPNGGIIEQGSTGDRRFVAVWELNAGETAFTLTFDANGGEVGTYSMSVLKGAAYGELPEPTRTGYDFDGWFTAAKGGEKATKYSVADGDATLYAHWTPVRYTITYVLDGGRNAADNPEWYTIEMEITLTTPTRDGYRFVEWTPDEGKIAKGTISNLTFTATWEEIVGEPVTVTFDANGGRTYEPMRTVAKGSTIGSLPEPVRNGYVVVGWFTERTGGAKISENTVVESSVTYYVHWKPENYNIIYVLNGGQNVASNPATYTIEDEVVLLAPTRSGYTFTGWTPDGGKIAKGSTGDKTFTATWNKNGTGGGGADPMPDPVIPDPVTPVVEEETYGGKVENVEFTKAQVVLGALYDTKGNLAGTVELKFGKINAKKQIVKVSGSATLIVGGKAKKITAKAVNVTVDATERVLPTTIAFKAPIGNMTFAMDADGVFTLKSDKYEMVGMRTRQSASLPVSVGGAMPNGMVHFNVDMDSVPDFGKDGSLLEVALPVNEPIKVSGGKWSFGKAASLKYAKNKAIGSYELIGRNDPAKPNVSGLKLTYTAKTGLFKGSFKLYATNEATTPSGKAPKLKKFTVNVIGFVVDGVGYGEATLKKPAGTWTVTVE